jgi:hypothetical protein
LGIKGPENHRSQSRNIVTENLHFFDPISCA